MTQVDGNKLTREIMA